MSGATEIKFDEEKRMEAVHSLELLDTDPEDRFDRICRLVREILGVPVSYIALMDDDRQFFKAECGLGVRQTPREGTFCDMTIRRTGPMVVEDADAHPSWKDSPFVAGPPHVKFYLGFPLFINDMQAVGTLCALDFEPRESVGEAQMALLIGPSTLRVFSQEAKILLVLKKTNQ